METSLGYAGGRGGSDEDSQRAVGTAGELALGEDWMGRGREARSQEHGTEREQDPATTAVPQHQNRVQLHPSLALIGFSLVFLATLGLWLLWRAISTALGPSSSADISALQAALLSCVLGYWETRTLL